MTQLKLDVFPSKASIFGDVFNHWSSGGFLRPCLRVNQRDGPRTLESDQLWYLHHSPTDNLCLLKGLFKFSLWEIHHVGNLLLDISFFAHIFRWGTPRQIQDVCIRVSTPSYFPIPTSPCAGLTTAPPEIARNPIDPRWLFLRLQYVSFFRSVRPGVFAEPEVDGIGRLWGAIRRAGGLWMFMGLCLWNWVFAGMRKEKG